MVVQLDMMVQQISHDMQMLKSLLRPRRLLLIALLTGQGRDLAYQPC